MRTARRLLSAGATLVLAAALMTAGGLPVGGPFTRAARAAEATVSTIRVEAYIDGRSLLSLHGNTAQWHHLDFAAPGRLGFVDEPTIINGTEWFPQWPDAPDKENRDCNCYSDEFDGVDPPLPLTDMTVTLRLIQSRYQTSIVQSPALVNDYTLIVQFDDNPLGGADWYVVEIDATLGAAAARLTVGDVAVVEGDAGTKAAAFPILLAEPASSDVSVSYHVASVDATRKVDFGPRRDGTVTIPAGSRRKQVCVVVFGDLLEESDEQFSLTITGASAGVQVVDPVGVATIYEDDPSGPVSVSIGDVWLTEGDVLRATVPLTLTLSAPLAMDVQVAFTTVDGTATAGSDYLARQGTATIPAGRTGLRLWIPVLGDLLAEPDEVFTVLLSSVAGAEIGRATGEVWIRNDDPTES